MNKKLWSLIICLLLAVLPFISAQTAAELEEVLNTQAVSYGEAARFVLKAADLPDFSGSEALPGSMEAFAFAAERKWLPKTAENNGKASLQDLSLLLMRSFNVKGGLFYSLFKNPHYAYRELVYQDLIQGRSDPGMDVSGNTLVFLINRIIARQSSDVDYDTDLAGERRQAAPPEPVFDLQIWRPAAAPPAISAEQAAERQALTEKINAQLESHDVTDTRARVTDEGITISLSNIQFLANSTDLPESEKKKLREITPILQSIPMRGLLVTGHTALAGTQQDRMQTSLDRARAVAAYLLSLGARNPGEIFIQGLGSDSPIADNSTPEGMALNRRVEIIILENRQ